MDLRVWYGGWDYWANVYDEEVIEMLLARKISELEQHETCPARGINVVRFPIPLSDSSSTIEIFPTSTPIPPTPIPSTITPIPPTFMPPTNTPQVSTSQSVIWQLNPALPQPQGFIGWISSKDSKDFQSGIWTRDVNVSITENQLLLVFGGLANLPTIGELGTKTSCFVIASRGPLNLSLDLMSARLEVHDVDTTATPLEWAAQKEKVMQEVYPLTCGKGVDIAVGK